MDFVSDAASGGRKIKILTVVDTFTRKCLGLLVDTSINGCRVCRALDEMVEREGCPEMIIVDNGPEFSGRALDEWAYRKGVKLYFIRQIEGRMSEQPLVRWPRPCQSDNR